MGKAVDLTGRVFGRLTALRYVGSEPRRGRLWACECACGEAKVASSTHLVFGIIHSCGCGKRERAASLNASHSHAKGRRLTKTYSRWLSMRKRCSAGMSKRNPDWAGYVGRGIGVCERWDRFENFLEDMGECPPGLTLDRIDPDGNYEPGNCRWADSATQSLNRRNTRMVTWLGKQLPLKTACLDLGIGYQAAYDLAVRRGLQFEEAVARLKQA